MSFSREPTVHLHRVDQELMAKIEERLKKGLAPPAEIYQVQNRDKIDWQQLPHWAWPLGPESFDGCSHEG